MALKKQRKLPPTRLTNYKKAVKLEEGLVAARERAKLKWKKSVKGTELSIREHIGKLIDKIDPLELGAVLGLTYIVKTTIYATTELLNKITEQISTIYRPKGGAPWLPQVWWQWIPFMEHAAPFLGWELPEYEPVKGMEKVTLIPKIGFDEFYIWVVSFVVAYFIMKHGGQIMGLLDKGLTAIIGMFLLK